MKMQIVTMKIDGNNFSISRKLTDTKTAATLIMQVAMSLS